MSLDTSNLQDSQERRDLRPNLEADFLRGVTVHAAKLRLTGILFPIGFVAVVRAGSPDRPVSFDRRSPSPRPLARHLGIHGQPFEGGLTIS